MFALNSIAPRRATAFADSLRKSSPPSPRVVTATTASGPGSWGTAALCLITVCLPSFLRVAGALPFWEAIRRTPMAQAALKCVNATAVGLLLATLCHPVWTGGHHQCTRLRAGDHAFLLIFMWQTLPWLGVVLSAANAGGAALAAFW
jgi:chromate transporter